MAKKFVQYNGMLIFSKIDLIGSLTLVMYKVHELFDKIGLFWASGICKKCPFLGFDRFRMSKIFVQF